MNLKKLWKLSLWACFFVIAGMALTACGGGENSADTNRTPSQTVKVFLDDFKAQDWEGMGQVYGGKTEEFKSVYGLASEDDETTAALRDAFLSRLFEFDYRVTGEEIAEDEKTATVDVSITTYDMVTAFNSFYTEYMEKALDTYTGKSNEMSPEDLEKMAIEILQEKVDEAEKDYTGQATLSLTNTKKGWIVNEIDENNTDFLNAVSGGMLDVAREIVDAKEGGDANDGKQTEDR